MLWRPRLGHDLFMLDTTIAAATMPKSRGGKCAPEGSVDGPDNQVRRRHSALPECRQRLLGQ